VGIETVLAEIPIGLEAASGSLCSMMVSSHAATQWAISQDVGLVRRARTTDDLERKITMRRRDL